MACILKKPGKTKGVITFTSIEFRREKGGKPATPLRSLLTNKDILRKIKKNWIIGFHASGQLGMEHSFNSVFDFALGRRGGALGRHCAASQLIEMDASCFTTSDFYPDKYENKFWDIIGIGKMGGARDLNPFLNIIRKIYNTNFFPRVLLISGNYRDEMSNLLSNYRSTFNRSVRDRFNIIDIKYNHPFGWDLETLSFFLRLSKIFLNGDEGGFQGLPARTFTYAVGSGLPFVTRPWKFPIVPKEFLKKPAHYFGNTGEELAQQCINALNSYSPDTQNNQYIRESVNWLNFDNSMIRFKKALAPLLETTLESLNSEEMNFNDLHFRINRHSSRNIGVGKNGTDIDINQIIKVLQDESLFNKIDTSADDVELALFKSLNNA